MPCFTGLSSGGGGDRESLLSLSDSLETRLAAPSSAKDLRRLHDGVSDLHSGCVALIDSVPATGRFRFRSLLNRLDEQARELDLAAASAGRGGGSADKVLGDLRGTVKEVAAVLRR